MKLNLPDILNGMLKQMELWYHTPLGLCLLEEEQTHLSRYLQTCFKDRLLQLGGPKQSLAPQANIYPIRLSPLADDSKSDSYVFIQGDFDALPFLPDSMDLIVVPHLLELIGDPIGVLTQIYSILAPQGHLIILGFNPWSVWGLVKCFPRVDLFPWKGHIHTAFSIKQQLIKTKFVIESIQTFFFRPPFTVSSTLKKTLLLESLGRLLWTDNGAVYMIIAQKKIVPLLPINQIVKDDKLSHLSILSRNI